MEPIPQDTPIIRASILAMDDAQLVQFIETLQAKRLKSWNIYEAGVRAKQEAQSCKDQAALEKTLEKLLKAYETVTKNIEKMEKLALDVQALRLTIGDLG